MKIKFKTDKIISALLTLGGLPGQIIARIFYKKGSIDKPYLFLFFMPPFSIVPSIFMLLDKIKDGENGNPYDYFSTILISIFIFFIFIILIIKNIIIKYKDIDLKFIFKIFNHLLFILLIFIIFNKKFNKLCKKSIKIKLLRFTLITIFISLILGKLILFYIEYKYFRKLNSLTKKLSNNKFKFFDVNIIIKDIKYLLTYVMISIIFIIIYVLHNMYNSKNINLNKTCNRLMNKKLTILAIIFNIIAPIII